MLRKPKTKHILELNGEERKHFLKSFDIIFSDCDGVIWMVAGIIPDSGSVINSFLQAGKQYKLVSNNSMRTDDDYLEKLSKMGVKGMTPEDIVHPVKAIADYLHKHKPNKAVYSMGCKVFNDYLRNSGIEVEEFKNRDDWTFESLTKCVLPVTDVGAVVIDFNFALSYASLIKAGQYLQKKETDLIVGATDVNAPLTKDTSIIGTSGFISLLVDHCSKDAIILGKPGALLGKYLKQKFHITDPKRVIFFGDTITQDMAFAQACGFQSLLMLSGATTKEEMLALPNNKQPDYYANSIADLKVLFKDESSNKV